MCPKVKFLILSYVFPPHTIGAATVMHNLCKSIPINNYLVITTSEELSLRRGVYDKEYALNCKTIRLPVCTTRLLDQFIFFWLAVFRGVLLNRKERISSILAVHPFYFDLLAGYVLHRLLSKPLVIYMHDLFSETNRSALLYKIWFLSEKIILSSASRVLVMNEKYIEHYSKRGIQNTAILPPSIDLEEYSAYGSRSPRLERNSKKLQIIYTGSISQPQREAVLTFLKAAAKLDDVEVHIASPSGMDSMKEHVYKYVREMNVGSLPKKECIALQKSADVLFLPLSKDSIHPEEIKVAFPCKLLEYLAAGKPILALVPRGSFVESFVNKYEVGVVVNDLSVDKTVVAINLLKNAELRDTLSQNALRTVKLFDSRRLCKQFLDVIDHVEEQSARDCTMIKCQDISWGAENWKE
jgi:glycosyltransferase involved in cell wall biosynthesis